MSSFPYHKSTPDNLPSITVVFALSNAADHFRPLRMHKTAISIFKLNLFSPRIGRRYYHICNWRASEECWFFNACSRGEIEGSRPKQTEPRRSTWLGRIDAVMPKLFPETFCDIDYRYHVFSLSIRFVFPVLHAGVVNVTGIPTSQIHIDCNSTWSISLLLWTTPYWF